MRSRPGSANVIVVDASVAVKWHLQDEQYVTESIALLEQFARGDVELVAPAHIRHEVASAITVATRGQSPRITHTQGREAIEEFLELGISTIDDSELILSAYRLVQEHGCAFYDSLYLALAQRLNVPLVVADRRFYQLVSELQEVVWAGDYRASA